jgi:predicted glutamine amidotransferase
MCVILDLLPGAEIPFDKLSLACDINKDGYGLAYASNGKLTVDHVVKFPNEPKVIGARLDKLKQHRRFLHLRHATVGAVNRQNAHPFPLLRKETDGADLWLMHNGTLGKWTPQLKDSTLSDTLLFANGYARPLAMRTARFLSPEKVLADDFFKFMMDREAAPYSTMLLFDNHGGVVHINESQWKRFDGWCASNDYSFDPQHIRSSSRVVPAWTHYGTPSNTTSYTGQDNRSARERAQTFLAELPEEARTSMAKYLDEDETWEAELILKDGGKKSVPHGKSQQRYFYEIDKVADAIVSQKQDKDSMTAVNTFLFQQLNVERKPFVEQAGLNSLTDVGRLSVTKFEELCGEYPSAMAQLYIDLIGEIVDRDIQIHKLKAEVAGAGS